MHRFVWDLHYPPPNALHHDYPISAIYRNTPRVPLGPYVLPGEYTIKLIAAGESHSRPLTVVMDPRIKTPMQELETQLTLSLELSEMMREDYDALSQLRGLREQIQSLKEKQTGSLKLAAVQFDNQLATLQGAHSAPLEGREPGAKQSLTRLNTDLARVLEILQGSDSGPTTQVIAAIEQLQKSLEKELSTWNQLRTEQLSKLNEQLRRANLPMVHSH